MTIDRVERVAQVDEATRNESVPVDISVLVVTWNSARWIERCLGSVRDAASGLELEIIVCDNASSDGTPSLLSSADEVIRSAHNDGFAAGINHAYARSRGRYLFLLNPDTQLPAGVLRTLYDFLQSSPRAAAAAPVLEDESGDSQREFQLRRLPTLASLIAEVFALGRFWPRLTRRYRYRDLDLSVPQRVEQPAAAALLIRREVFDEIGPFDEQFEPAWFEDVDYCRRLAAAGKEIWAVPTSAVRHFGGSSLESLSFLEFNLFWYRNMRSYAQKWLGEGQAETLRWAIIVSMLLRSAAAAAGVASRQIGRRQTFTASSMVLKEAFARWGVSSRSSS